MTARRSRPASCSGGKTSPRPPSARSSGTTACASTGAKPYGRQMVFWIHACLRCPSRGKEHAMINGLFVIDADSHVEEIEDTWRFLEPPYSERPPLVVEQRGAPGLPIQDAFWVIDGRVLPRLKGRGSTVYATPVVSTFGQMKPFSIPSQ